ncbi:substrate-binding domain-containing protein [Arthrobacter sp. P2b]|uniref:substrate-binding domain-containing protein n=1 Tax=Arthrobacter sp. P2b TaxID=1938741 RepID=UPI0009CADAE7|nr:substrate-binding domain-containing protein [Arthrobacter sp. P2b]SLK16954.1 ribose transport system substrate-binding protein [Arthrobacter sp. P2b]
MNRTKMATQTVVGLAIASVSLAACSPTPSGEGGASAEAVYVKSDRTAEVSSWCGDKKLTIGMSDGANNAARKQMLKVIENEVAKCDSLDSNVLYANADGDQQKASSDISGLVSRGVNVLLINPDFGPAQLPAIRAATQAGVVVIPMVVDPGGTPGADYAAKVYRDGAVDGKNLAGWMVTALKGKGNVVHLGGIAGNPFSGAAHKGIEEVFAASPDIKLMNDEPVTTNWSAAGAQTAMTGLLASNPQIDGVITESGEVAEAVANVFANAGLPIPPIATSSITNALGCSYEEFAERGKAYPLFSADHVFDNVSLALRTGVMVANGKEAPKNQVYELTPTVDTIQGKNPVCKPDLPAGADPSSPLTDAEIKALFQ